MRVEEAIGGLLAPMSGTLQIQPVAVMSQGRVSSNPKPRVPGPAGTHGETARKLTGNGPGPGGEGSLLAASVKLGSLVIACTIGLRGVPCMLF